LADPVRQRPRSLPRPTPAYRTARLLLRHFTLDDLDAFLAMHGDPEVVRYVPYPPLTRAQAAERLARVATMTSIDDESQNLRFAAVLPESGEVIGDFSLWSTPGDRLTGSMGFVVDPRFQGKGYASEAAAELLRIGFEEVGLHRITADCDARNAASYRVMERIGMRREAHFVRNAFEKGEWADELVYAILADEWRARRSV
jgi:RimJ/RimL family protein N-acetyltransferase